MKFVFHNYKNNIFIICVSLTLLLVSLNYEIVFFIYFLFNFYVYKKDKGLFYLNLGISVLIILGYGLIKLYQEYLINHYRGNITGKITKIKETPFYTKLTLRYKFFKVNVITLEKNDYELGMKIWVSGKAKIIERNHLPNGFNYQKYFYNNLYILEIEASKIEVKSRGFSIYFLSDLIEKYLKFFFSGDSLIILEGFILGNTSNFSQNFSESLKINGIVHLFAVSGLHVSIIIGILDKNLGKSKKKKTIINVILGMYLVITRFMVSIVRAVMTYYLKEILIKYDIKMTSLDITSMVYIIIMMVNPYYFYNLGFELSFFATFIILLISDIVKDMGKIKSLIVITCIINAFTLPFLVNTNNNFNILTPFINLIMVFLVETIVLPLSFLVFFLPILNKGFDFVIKAFIYISEMMASLSKYSGMVIIIASLSSFLILIYYILLYIFIKFYKNIKIKRVMIGFFIIFLGFLYFNGSVVSNPKVTFFDVSVGDATLIEVKNEKILIDTGIGRNNELTSCLQSLGVKSIDYLIITHNHKDHNGELAPIYENIRVKAIVISKFDDEKIKYNTKIVKLKKNDKLKTKYLEFLCLSPNSYSDNINNNSLVLYVKINNTSLLFTGDAEKEVEEDININVDILKVGHHGSNTSTTNDFLGRIKPKYAVIESGRENSFEFPSKIIVDRLKRRGIKTYITKYDYTITLIIKKNTIKFSCLNEKT